MRFEAGGVVRAVFDLCAAMAHAGHEIVLFSADVDDLPADWRTPTPGRPRAVALGEPNRFTGLYRSETLRAVRDALADADVLHLHSMWTTPNIQLARLAREHDVPYVYSVHGMLDDWCLAQRALKKKLYLATFGHRLLHNAAVVHCTAQDELNQAQRHFPVDRGAVVPLIMDLDDYQTLPGHAPARERFTALHNEEPKLLFLSRLHYKKGIEHLLRACRMLNDERRPCHVYVAGSGEQSYMDRLRRLIDEMGINDRVHFLGFVTGKEKVSLYQCADVFVLPTSQENFGFVLFEALASGTPVITTRGTDTWPELESSGGALIVDQDARQIADAVGALLDDPGKRREMGDQGRAWIFKTFAPEAIVEQYENLYARAVEKTKPG